MQAFFLDCALNQNITVMETFEKMRVKFDLKPGEKFEVKLNYIVPEDKDDSNDENSAGKEKEEEAE